MATKKTTTKLPETLRRQMLDHVHASRDQAMHRVNTLLLKEIDELAAKYLKKVDAPALARKIKAAEKRVENAQHKVGDLMAEARVMGLTDSATDVSQHTHFRPGREATSSLEHREYCREAGILDKCRTDTQSNIFEVHKRKQYHCCTEILNAKTIEEGQAALKKFTSMLEKYHEQI